MDEKVLLGWKEAHADVYSKFKQDLKTQLLQPYHQTILDMGDENAEALKSVIANFAAISTENGFDIDKLYTKAVESDDVYAYCLCCYLQFDNGEDRLADAIADKVEKPDAQEILDAVQEYRRFYKQNRKQEVAEITTDELNILTLRRWHYDHPEEYKEFTDTFQKAYDGDMTFIQTNFFFLMEMFSTKGVKGMMKIVASLFPGNKHYQQSLMGSDENPLKGRLSEMLDSSLNNEAIRERLLHKNPYLFSLYYWIIFDNGFLHAADLISQTFLKPGSPYWGLPNSSDDTYRLFSQFALQYNLTPYRTEWAIFDEDSKVAGTLDFLNYKDGVFTIYDWKRSNKVVVNGQPEKISRWGKRAFKPILHIHDTTFWHYASAALLP